MNTKIRSLLAVAGLAVCSQAAAQITFYEQEGFAGRTFTNVDRRIRDFRERGFNASASAVVTANRWEVCDDANFGGRCMILRPGRYPSLGAMGLNDRISSVRIIDANVRIDDTRYAPIPVPPPVPGAAQVTFYERDGFAGRSFTATQEIRNFERFGFNDRASSVIVVGDRWEVCDDVRFNGRCVVLRPGRYASLAALGLNDRVSSVRRIPPNIRIEANRYAPAHVVAAPPPVQAQIVFYENENFGGRSLPTTQQIADFNRFGFNDQASSVVVLANQWEVCEQPGFAGRCRVLSPGRYPALAAMGLNDRISSVRMVNPNTPIEPSRQAPTPLGVYDNRRRPDERVYEATVTSVRAVVGPPEQRCWVEREQVQAPAANLNVPGALIGAVIGGVLGHQVGGGRGKDLATVGGAVAGGAVGSQVGRTDAQQAQTREVQRCENVPSQAKPSHWDVIYSFRGQEHRIQMTTPPGPTILVNEIGEPRA